MLADEVPELHEALERAKDAGFSHVILDGKIIACEARGRGRGAGGWEHPGWGAGGWEHPGWGAGGGGASGGGCLVTRQ